MKKRSIVLVVLMAIALFSGCAALDVILRDAPASLNQILEHSPNIVQDSASTSDYWSLSVDGETTLKVSHDYSMTETEDLVMQTPLKPFVDAGLDPARLGTGYRADATMLYLTADFGDGSGKQDTFTNALFESVKADRKILSYHADLDHFGIQLPAGKVEWAKDESTNDKDIVFVIAAKPLADLGVDVQNIDGWIFKTMKDDAGRDFDVLLKPYSLEA